MKSRRERKEKLMEVAEEQIEKLLDWMESTEAPNLEMIEETVINIRKRISEEMTETVIENQANVNPIPEPACSKCEKRMRRKGKKKRDYKLDRRYRIRKRAFLL